MTAEERALEQQRTRMLLVNLAYFLVLLALGVLFLSTDTGGSAAYLLVALCVVGYLMLVRPMWGRYIAAIRETIIRLTVCAGLESLTYEPKDGVSVEAIQATGLFPGVRSGTFMSREHITGRIGPIWAELADVTFPIAEDGRNAMFSGAFINLTWLGAALPPLIVRSGDIGSTDLPKKQRVLIEKLGALIPDSLYLCSGGERLTLLLRGRFLGFPVNPLLSAGSQSLQANPFPELDQAIQLIQLMGKAEASQLGENKEKGADCI